MNWWVIPLLLWAAGSGLAQQGELVLGIRRPDGRYAMTTVPEVQPGNHRKFRKAMGRWAGQRLEPVLGQDYRQSTSYKGAMLMADPRYTYHLRRALRSGPNEQAYVLLDPTDTSAAPVHPHQTYRRVHEIGTRGNGDWKAIVRVGEHGETPGDLAATIGHEFGHVADGSLRPDYGSFGPYGPDGAHYLDEALPLAEGFSEGAANWFSMMANPYKSDWVRNAVHAGPPHRLRVEHPTRAGVYQTLGRADARLGHYLGNEVAVAGVMNDFSKAFGRRGVEQVFQDTTRDAVGPTLVDFMGGYSQRYPKSTGYMTNVLRHWTGNSGSTRDYRDILAGRHPAGTSPAGAPHYPGPGESAAERAAAHLRARIDRGLTPGRPVGAPAGPRPGGLPMGDTLD